MTTNAPSTPATSLARTVFSAVFCSAAIFIFASSTARAQALPAAEASPISTGFTLPSLGGSLQWAVTGSGSLDWGYYNTGGVAPGLVLSGDVAYLSESQFHPFSMVLSAGRNWGWSGQPSYQFAGLGLSQVVNVGRWNFTFSDNVNYLPQTATGSLSGIAGIGDLGVPPVQTGPDAGQGVLTNYSPRVSNSGGASVQRQITGKTALNASGSYSILRFVGDANSANGDGLESDAVTGSAGFTHRIDARNSFGGNYAYSSIIFLRNLSSTVLEPNFVSQTASITYTHQFNRRLSANLTAGPQWTQINAAQNSVSVNGYADASLNYITEFGHMNVDYVRSTNSGYGVTGGALSDAVSFAASRLYGRVWDTSARVGWTRTSGLPTPSVPSYDFKTLVAGVQVSRALMRNLSGFASYTAEYQSHASTVGAVDLFDGLNHIISFGITYSPTSRRLARP